MGYMYIGSTRVAVPTVVVGNTGTTEKYGATLNTFLGDIGQNGYYPVYSNETVDFRLPLGTTAIGDYAFTHKFAHSQAINSFSTYTTNVGNYAFQNAFEKSSIQNVQFDNVNYVKNNTFANAYYGCKNIETIKYPSVINVDSYGFDNAFGNSSITNAYFNSLANTAEGAFRNAFKFCNNLTEVSFSQLKYMSAGDYCFANAFDHCSKLTHVTIEQITVLGWNGGAGQYHNMFQGAFQYCTNIVESNWSSLNAIRGSGMLQGAYMNCRNLTTVSCPSLKMINAYASGSSVTKPLIVNVMESMCKNCPNLTNFYVPHLYIINAKSCLENAFVNCTNLQSMAFPALTTAQGANLFSNAFSNSGIKDIYFNSLTTTVQTAFPNMLYGVNDCNVHFPSALEATINSWDVVINGFGGNNTTVLYDL